MEPFNMYTNILDPLTIPSFPIDAYIQNSLSTTCTPPNVSDATISTKISNKTKIIPLEKLEKRVEELEQQVKELTDLLNNKEYSEPSADLGFIVCDLEK